MSVAPVITIDQKEWVLIEGGFLVEIRNVAYACNMTEIYYKAIIAGDIKAEVVDFCHTVADKNILVAVCRIHPACQS